MSQPKDVLVVVRDYGDLTDLVEATKARKPAMGQPCNHCGWCCITEVCGMGQQITGSSEIPCKLLEKRDGGYYCKAASAMPLAAKMIGAGNGCCAITVEEKLAKLWDGI